MVYEGSETTISVRMVQVVRSALRARGIDPGPLLAAAGIEAQAVDDPAQRVADSAVLELLRRCAQVTGEPHFAVRAAQHYEPGANVFDYAGAASATLALALERVCRYATLIDDALAPKVEKLGATSRVAFHTRGDHEQPPEIAAYSMAVAVVAAQRWLGLTFPVEVHFRHAAPSDVSAYQEVFGGGPLRFGMSDNAILFPTAALNLPLKGADPELASVMDRQATRMLAARPRKADLVTRLRTLLELELPGGNASAERLAERLNMSPRTLRRRLQEHDTSYQKVLDALRRELAERYLREPAPVIDQVADRLGFADATSFHRAFKRWTGMTPAEFARRESA